MFNFRPAAMIATAAVLALGALAPIASATEQVTTNQDDIAVVTTSVHQLPVGDPCPLHATTCVPYPGFFDIPNPGPGGGNSGGAPTGGDDGIGKDTFCDRLKDSMGSYANTPAGMAKLASFGCA
jgi:hypothetical protein